MTLLQNKQFRDPMEPTPSKPTKKGRRWLIGAFFLVLVSLISWWHWPRGDTRFVGSWDSHYSDDVGEVGTFELRRNGTGIFVSKDASRNICFAWHASDDILSMGADANGNARAVLNAVATALHKWTGRTFCPERCDYQILSISDEEIQMTDEGADGRIVLTRRIPE